VSAHDRKFFNTFLLVLGILILISGGLYALSRVVATSQEQHVSADAKVKEAITERIRPVARLAVAGLDNSALAAQTKSTAPATDLPGKEVYETACMVCHGAGVAGAPKFADAAAWKERIAQGADVLHKHALEGFQGKAGFMPAKGGQTALTDKSVTNAVDYMTDAVKK
jgi:cytochrome c5